MAVAYPRAQCHACKQKSDRCALRIGIQVIQQQFEAAVMTVEGDSNLKHGSTILSEGKNIIGAEISPFASVPGVLQPVHFVQLS